MGGVGDGGLGDAEGFAACAEGLAGDDGAGGGGSPAGHLPFGDGAGGAERGIVVVTRWWSAAELDFEGVEAIGGGVEGILNRFESVAESGDFLAGGEDGVERAGRAAGVRARLARLRTALWWSAGWVRAHIPTNYFARGPLWPNGAACGKGLGAN